MIAPPTEACLMCNAARPRAERAEALLAETQAHLAAIQQQRAFRQHRKRPSAPSEN